ncbi:MAG: ribosomal protein L7/L12 [Bradymonadia bacterium]
MKRLRIVTDLEPLAGALLKTFEELDLDQVDHHRTAVDRLELRYREGEGEARLTQILDCIKPLQPSVLMDARLTEADLELYLGDQKGLSDWKVKIYSDSEGVAQSFRGFAREMGFADAGQEMGFQKQALLAYGGASPFARQVLRWFAASQGVHLTEEKRWGDDDHDIWLYIPDPVLADKRPRERFEVEVVCDEYERGRAVMGLLEKAGFERLTLRVMDVEDARHSKFTIEPGAFRKGTGLEDFELMQRVVAEHLEDAGLDPARYPLEVEGDEDNLKARVILPLGIYARGELPPYVGDIPERFSVTLRTDDLNGVRTLQSQLQGMGFHRVAVEMAGSRLLGFQIQWGSARDAYDVRGQVKELIERQMEELSVPTDMELFTTFASSGGQSASEIVIDFPTTGLDDGRLKRRLEMACNEWEFTFKAPDPDQYRPVTDAMRTLQWKSFETEHESISEPRIKYGGAPPALVAWIREQVHRLSGTRAELDKAWDNDDDDIWVCLPAPGEETVDTPGPIDLSSWFEDREDAPVPFLEIGAQAIRVGEVTLRRRPQGGTDSGLVPEAEQFLHYCLDQRTAETISHVALSVSLSEPCLLEGETSTSKTSSVLYLASLLNQPVVRLNLNGQTDTGELIGRFLPESLTRLPVEPEELLAHRDDLKASTVQLLERALGEGRDLTEVEVQQIIRDEDLPTRPWRWQDGLVVGAMKRGWWVVLDELNLAEPQILERLNSVLERTPSLVLTEHDNSVLGPGGAPVHPNFRIFATMNPAEYAGRTALSPAYRDRWTGYRYVSSPGEAEYLAMLRFLVYGAQPEVGLYGAAFTGPAIEGPAPMANLADLPYIDAFLEALARFHAALESAVGRSEDRAPLLGARRKERYVFTRRGLLSVMDYLSRITASHGTDANGATRAMRMSLARYYLGRISSPEDQQTVARLLDAAGIGPNTWSPGEAEEDEEQPQTESRRATVEIHDPSDAPELTEFVLRELGPRKISILKEIRSLTGDSIKRTKLLLDSLPASFSVRVSRPEAMSIVKRFEGLGARMSFKRPTRPPEPSKVSDDDIPF